MKTTSHAAPARAIPRTIPWAASLTALVVLAGCAGTPVVFPSTATDGYEPEILNYAASRGGMLTEVVGNPFNAPKAELEAVVVETAARSHFGPPQPFFTQAPEDYASPYRMVYVMNPTPGTSPDEICEGKAELRARAPSESDWVAGALCARENAVTWARGYVAGPLGPRDPAFVSLISQITRELLPPEDIERRDRNGRFRLSFLNG